MPETNITLLFIRVTPMNNARETGIFEGGFYSYQTEVNHFVTQYQSAYIFQWPFSFNQLPKEIDFILR